MKRGVSLILVVALALAASCVGGRKGTRGGSGGVGSGSDEGGPWSQGQTPAAMEKKKAGRVQPER
jgi:hypothetical protein